MWVQYIETGQVFNLDVFDQVFAAVQLERSSSSRGYIGSVVKDDGSFTIQQRRSVFILQQNMRHGFSGCSTTLQLDCSEVIGEWKTGYWVEDRIIWQDDDDDDDEIISQFNFMDE